VVKRVVPEYKGWAEWEVIALKDGDRVVGAGPAADADELVFVTSDAQLLRTAAREARAQGRAAGGMAGVKLAEGARVLWFGTVAKAERDAALVATLATGPRPDAPWTAKVTPFAQFPAKGRATGGVRCHRFLKDQDHLALAWVGLPPARACDADGNFRNLPATDDRRDGTGTKVYASFAHLG
jgi:DNA gyrase subunit A